MEPFTTSPDRLVLIGCDQYKLLKREATGTDLQIHDDGLDQEEDGGVVLPVDVGGGFTQFDAGDGGALHQLLAATLTC